MTQLAHLAIHQKVGGSNPPRGITFWLGFPGGSDGKETAFNVGDPGSIPGSERSPGKGNAYALQQSCLENPLEESDELQSMVSQRVRQDWATNTFTSYVRQLSLPWRRNKIKKKDGACWGELRFYTRWSRKVSLRQVLCAWRLERYEGKCHGEVWEEIPGRESSGHRSSEATISKAYFM